ncbi:PR5-like receptor kinase [Colletotrichum siamense]|uniref:non-specific serine/threonine protein kinase n=1 Tax=Colletotrichum siamense TaxID=690259 RepID=A0A9P5K4K1_COLSI|nr:PR5-like receptor kinase [Colletotrichum siamense]KAF4858391.1 PR5-like receptor kinase [Colletotrichum siamense]
MSENQIIAQLRRHVDDYIERYDCHGVNGYGSRLPFVPEVALTDFWSVEKITAVLCHDEDLVLHNPEVVMEHYIVVFSILVLTSKAANLDLFTQLDLSDKSLPLDTTPKSYRDSTYNDVFESFMDMQWKFCPMSLYLPLGPKPSKRNLLPDVILPISGKEKINPKANEEINTAVLYKTELHRLSIQETVPVVFKEYLKASQDSQRLFDNEWAMYSHLREDSFDHIVRYYGSFSCLGRRTIVLEHAPGGDLLSFFRDRKIPHTDWHRKQFWQNIFGLLEGLVAIDDVTRHHLHTRDTWHLRGTHQDIRPQNILLCGYPSDDDYSVPFKFADMGTAHIRKVKNDGIDRHAVDQFGNGMYSAPEAYRDNGVATGIGHKSDVYSLGGILSEAFIWSIWGERGREAYQAERVEATWEFKLKGGFHEGAFHDGDGLLHVVEKWHDRAVALTDGRADALSQLIMKSMLAADPERRMTATQVSQAFRAIISTLESDSEPQDYLSKQRKGWPLSPLSLATRSRTTPAGSRDAGQVSTSTTRIQRVSSMQAIKSSIAPFLTASPGPMEPPIFIVDDSKSMKHHQEQAARTCRVLGKLLKKGEVDNDGQFELYFASKGTCNKVRDSTELQRLVDASPFSSPRCEMRTILDQVATKVIRENQMVSIYVLTNGHWNLQDPRDLCGVEKPIERIVKHMVKKDHQGNWAMIQFVGFYRDLHSEADRYGKARLKYLDDGLKLERDMDIVDTRNAKKDVTKILLGSFSTEADDSPSESDD